MSWPRSLMASSVNSASVVSSQRLCRARTARRADASRRCLRQLLKFPARSSSPSHDNRRLDLTGAFQNATAARLPSNGACAFNDIGLFEKERPIRSDKTGHMGVVGLMTNAWAQRDQNAATGWSRMTFGQNISEAGVSLRWPSGRSGPLQIGAFVAIITCSRRANAGPNTITPVPFLPSEYGLAF